MKLGLGRSCVISCVIRKIGQRIGRGSLFAALVVLTLVAATGRAAHAAAEGATPVFRRFALVISSNDGGRGRASLHFADSDAGSVARVLESLGGVEHRDLVEVKQASRERLRAAFAELRARVGLRGRAGLQPPAGSHTRTEVFVYYSGHSDEDGLLLGDERVPYRELRGWIEEAGADVRIAVLDSCASGALVRLKGGIHRPPFLSDLSAQTRGHAYLTASSADESAQESDRIGSAFFTHYFISGLRGAADTNRDRRVTLNEAYHFAYNETLRRTEGSMAGAQHPAYDIQLAGTGDLVITDLRAPRARLVMPERMAGRIYVRDDAGRLVAELRKEPTYPVELGLEPGAYHVVLDRDGHAGEASVRLEEGGSVSLADEQFTAMPPIFAAVRGTTPQAAPDAGPDAGPASAGGNLSGPAVRAAGSGGPAAEVTATAAPAAPTLVTVPFAVGIWPSLDARPGQRVHNRFVLGLLIAHSDELDGLQLSLVGSVTEARMHGAQISNAFNLARGSSEGLQLSAGVNISTGQFRGLQFAPVNVAMGGAGAFRGAQLGVVNVSQGQLEGASVGVVNLAQSQRGASVGVVNLAGEQTGHAIGVVNVERKVEGFSLGVVNVAGEVEGESLGIVTWAGNGIHQVDALASDVAPLGLGLKLGTRHLYTAYELGFAPGTDRANDVVPTRGSRRYAVGLGVGYRMLARQTHFLDLAIMGYGVHHAPFVGEGAAANTTLGSLRLTFGWRLLPHLALMAGPTFNVAVGWSGADLDLGPGPSWLESVKRSGSTTVRMYPGFVAGVEL
jgi:hypothetical protein